MSEDQKILGAHPLGSEALPEMERDAIYAAMGDAVRFMDPPDGGDPTLAEMVGNMRRQLDAAEARVASPKTIDCPQVSEWTVLANARRICAQKHKRQPNWVLAMDAFGLGSTWAWALCKRVGVDPDGLTMAAPKLKALADATPNQGAPNNVG